MFGTALDKLFDSLDSLFIWAGVGIVLTSLLGIVGFSFLIFEIIHHVHIS